MSNKKEQSRPIRMVFFVSNSTGITAETLGHTLLYQFPTSTFELHTLRFIDTTQKAEDAVATINQSVLETGLRPIIISTLVIPELRQILASAQGRFLDVFDLFITPMEEELSCEAKLGMGHVHGVGDNTNYSERIDAVNYTLRTDDGVAVKDYSQSDIILIGASRTGKTPTSLYLALHYGVNAANYPLVDEALDSHLLPKSIIEFRDKIFGLIISPERLQSIRTKRKADSQYASLAQCQYEIRQTETLFQQQDIPYLDVSNMSVEEIASTIMNRLEH